MQIVKDAVLHWAVRTDVLDPGRYTLTVEFTNEQFADSTTLPQVADDAGTGHVSV